MIDTKICTKCREDRPLVEFCRNKNSKDGLNCWCKQCAKQSKKNWDAEHKQERAAYFRQWSQVNSTHLRETKREWKQNNRDKVAIQSHRAYVKRKNQHMADSRRWYEDHREIVSARNRDRYIASRERILTRVKDYYQSNKDRVKARVSIWQRAHPEAGSRHRALRRSRMRGAEGEFTADHVRAMLAAQHSRCVYCLRDIAHAYSVDHIIPISRGGSNWPENVQLLCKSCNSSKGTKTHEEYLEYLNALDYSAA